MFKKRVFTLILGTLLFLFPIGCTKNESPPSPVPSKEQGLLQGTVTDEQGQPVAQAAVEPIPQFQVSLPEIGKVTDEKGKFQWSLPIGKYQIKIAKEGYQPVTKEINLTEKGASLTFVLKKEKEK
ncbi:carboxypeptidase-like regulatory domain-containing protein [Thermoflavimicrobium dichotomicum]|uniref:Carboxypeptidase regulatory-like domain-containing protein n=1 Tax=Thermoflavimicrobium dichotomicum TaxID=46223 RepID=A0A1I3R9I9_9BACL|nr:carboxypeptidase-like regulatory domain-containing protein [Thermoflavimicrobium dichotomicum]SFJ43273.1 Carboxypeptidase regulatory-like domain-containing protein [Thermoflavimicrobium dichotomicum]